MFGLSCCRWGVGRGGGSGVVGVGRGGVISV